MTFAENALIKARAAAAHTGLPALADDSGHLRRRAGRRARHLLGALGRARTATRRRTSRCCSTSSPTSRDAHRARALHCAIALVVPEPPGRRLEDGRRGRVAGSHRHEAARRERLRLRPDLRARTATTSTAAELAPDEKNAESHRARAFDGDRAGAAASCATVRRSSCRDRAAENGTHSHLARSRLAARERSTVEAWAMSHDHGHARQPQPAR